MFLIYSVLSSVIGILSLSWNEHSQIMNKKLETLHKQLVTNQKK